MITMQFDDIQKIWDAQRNETLYAINEEALHRRIKSKKRKIERIHRINTIGLILISIIVSSVLLIIKANDIYNAGSAIMLMAIAVYVFLRDRKRKKALKQYKKTMLGDIDHTIKNLKDQIRFAQTFWLWYIIPLGIPKLLELLSGNINYWSITVLLAGFALSILIVTWEVNARFKPQLRRLLKLRENFVNGESISNPAE